MIENPARSCDPSRIGIAASPSGAKPTAIVAGPQSAPVAIVVGPIPNRPESRVAANAATNEPAAPIENTSPITPADSPSSRTANTRKIENATLEKKLDVAVQPAWARRLGL